MPGRKLWSYVEIARHIGVQAETVRTYKRHGLLPHPDRVDSGYRPRWYPETIRHWARSRPGRR
ncbi:MerR family DNA-binding transcriptional regulator [Kitasatospora sp. NPDC059646]|uniref:MerR family DNA-binding transcriptional regulator n=1 Tax=Kitasatospora sp. NPDC059646 TaxID=3346893 RepID=UPI003687EE42